MRKMTAEETFFIRNERTEFTVSVVHSRKLTLRVAAEMELGRERMRDEELTTDAESDFPVYKKRQKMNVSELKISKKDTYRIKEEIVLPGTKESIGQILFFDISGRKAETAPDRMNCLYGARRKYSACICHRKKKWNGLNRACRMREGFHAKAQRKI